MKKSIWYHLLSLSYSDAVFYDRHGVVDFDRLGRAEESSTFRREKTNNNNEKSSSSKGHSKLTTTETTRCQVIDVLLTREDIDAGFIDGFDSFTDIDFGTIQGGKVLLSNPADSSDKIGEYTVLTTFLSKFDVATGTVDCLGQGAYQFGTGQQIAFTSPCTGTPYFTITGGQGDYNGAYGSVHFMIPHEEGFLHRLNVCTPS